MQATLPEIRQTVVMNAPIQKVWDAVATADGIAAWFMPNNFEPVLGHEFALESPFGSSPCKVTEIDPPTRLAFDWGAEWFVTFELKELEGKTEFTLVHGGWDADKVTEIGETHTAVREKMDHGWRAAVLPRLVEFVEAK